MKLDAKKKKLMLKVFAILAIPLGLWVIVVGYLADANRDNYYDCRQNAMDGLHQNLGDYIDLNHDPEYWVPLWDDAFHKWHEELHECEQ